MTLNMEHLIAIICGAISALSGVALVAWREFGSILQRVSLIEERIAHLESRTGEDREEMRVWRKEISDKIEDVRESMHSVMMELQALRNSSNSARQQGD